MFSFADRALAYSVGRVAFWVGVVTLRYLVLAVPGGRLGDRIDRAKGGATEASELELSIHRRHESDSKLLDGRAAEVAEVSVVGSIPREVDNWADEEAMLFGVMTDRRRPLGAPPSASCSS
jgi:hypothetical protein